MPGVVGTRGDYLVELRRVAAAQPTATAVIDEGQHTSYREFIEEVDRRADRLAEAGLQPGGRIALVAENSSKFLISALAVWTAGGVLATIYPSTGREDLRYTLHNADPALVLVDRTTSGAVHAAVEELPTAVIDGTDFAPPAVRTGTMPTPPDLREPVALICYSSGTTSRPKAIMLSQTALYNGARTYADVWRLSSADRTIVCLPMAWLYGLDSTSMATLLAGGTVIALRRARPELLVEAIESHRVTFLPGVTTVFTKLVDHLERSPGRPDLSSLRLAVSGGEPRNEAAFQRFAELVGRPVHDTFCASECFPLITYDPVADPYPVPGSAGRLVPRSELRIVDPDGKETPTGEVGEAFSRGPGLMLGYWRDEEESAKVLTPDGWYRTRDLVRRDEDGFVYVVGRLSDMIIRGGSNVSPAEVERALREDPDVRDATVVGLPDPIYGQAVAAAVVVEDGATFDPDRIRRDLGEHLAAYKVPTRLVRVDRLPNNATTGKVDRRAVAALLSEEGNAA
ncbi:class I adenylate-forming enzyme family protein [Streptomyces phaeochromogenes]|uniref:class I adenylate-forming enzyme family protein n=1 Tax=Streptomyces phaeochromogenes TaxID=1923 RepID=UPI0038648198|nr:acyl--CoA ligase [Streptomyces phaeochromogenes]